MRIIYANNRGERIYVQVPWGLQSGMIPPPEIAFFIGAGRSETYYYQGNEE